MITHHLDIATLISCSAGSQPEALAAVTAAHLAVCASCTAQLAKAHVIGEAMFASLHPVALSQSAPTAFSTPAARSPSADGSIPLPAICTLGHDRSDIQWDKVASGVWTAPIPLSAEANGSLHLLKLAPGVTQPSAQTSGSKLSIVVSGSYQDGDKTFLPGDVADYDTQSDHVKAANPDTGCVCLIATDR